MLLLDSTNNVELVRMLHNFMPKSADKLWKCTIILQYIKFYKIQLYILYHCINVAFILGSVH